MTYADCIELPYEAVDVRETLLKEAIKRGSAFLAERSDALATTILVKDEAHHVICKVTVQRYQKRATVKS